MSNKELISKIKAEIERRKKEIHATVFNDEFDSLLSFVSTLGSEKPVPNDLEEAAVDIADALLSKPKDYVLSAKADYWNGAHDGIIAGAKWQKEQMISALKNDGELPIEFIDKFHEIDRIAFQNGQANMKEQMMKEAVEGEVCGRVYDHINVRFADGVCKFLEPKNISHIPADVSKYKVGDKVRIIIVKEN